MTDPARYLNDLRPVMRSGPAFECGECMAPILPGHVYYVDGSDVHGARPYCWLCGVSIKLHLEQIKPEDLPTIRQFGPL